jgi:hypothetical protein
MTPPGRASSSILRAGACRILRFAWDPHEHCALSPFSSFLQQKLVASYVAFLDPAFWFTFGPNPAGSHCFTLGGAGKDDGGHHHHGLREE